MKALTWIWLTAIVSIATVTCGLANAQSIPRLKPIPPRGSRHGIVTPARTAADSAGSPWQPLKNQPPFTSNSCNGGQPGAANPLLLTDGTVIVQDAGCQDWWHLTYDPRVDVWKPVNPPAGWTTIGDAQSVVLANDTFMQANCCTPEATGCSVVH